MDDMILIESVTLRQKLCTEENTAILERIGNLITLPETGSATVEQIAMFYIVSVETIKTIVKRHHDELEQDGYRVFTREELGDIPTEFFHFKSRFIAIFPRKAILRIGMLLVNSEVAKLVRCYLLAIEEQSVIANTNQALLMKIADQLTEQAQKLAENECELTRHSMELDGHFHQMRKITEQSSQNTRQLVSQAELIKAIVAEMYRNRDDIQQVSKRLQDLELRFSSWDIRQVQPALPQVEYITQEQIEILKAKVKEMGKRQTAAVWKKMNKHFGISRYKFLPKNRLGEALEWLEKTAL